MRRHVAAHSARVMCVAASHKFKHSRYSCSGPRVACWADGAVVAAFGCAGAAGAATFGADGVALGAVAFVPGVGAREFGVGDAGAAGLGLCGLADGALGAEGACVEGEDDAPDVPEEDVPDDEL